MKIVNVEIMLYEFAELGDIAKEKVIEEHRRFMLDIMRVSDFEDQEDYDSCYDDMEQNDEPVIENIECNDYLYFVDGELASITHYCGDHEKSGITEFKFHGKIYQI